MDCSFHDFIKYKNSKSEFSSLIYRNYSYRMKDLNNINSASDLKKALGNPQSQRMNSEIAALFNELEELRDEDRIDEKLYMLRVK